jgi:predicted nucleic acid-binding protein
MKLVGNVYFDTNIIIYLTEGSRVYHQQVLLLESIINSGDILISTSEISQMELLTGIFKKGDHKNADAYLSYIKNKVIDDYIPVSSIVLRKAAEIRATSRLKSMDAIHLASAISANCDIFLTNDRAFTSDALDIAYFDELT